MQQEPPDEPGRHVDATRETVAGRVVPVPPQAALAVPVRTQVVPVPSSRSRWRHSLTALRTAVPTLVRHPVVRAAAPWAGVGAGLLLGRLAGARRPEGPVQVEGTLRIEVVQRVVAHIVHETVHVPPRGLPPGSGTGGSAHR